MHKFLNNLFGVQRILFITIVSSFLISMTSCDEDDDIDNNGEKGTEIIDPYKREGMIRFYSNGEEFTFSNIVEYPFVKITSSGIGYDTIGRAYTGYPDPYSIIGSMQFTVLNDSLKLYSFEYRFPTHENMATVFRQAGDKADVRPFKFEIQDQGSIMKGYFSGSLSPGIGPDVFVIDSCFFSIQK